MNLKFKFSLIILIALFSCSENTQLKDTNNQTKNKENLYNDIKKDSLNLVSIGMKNRSDLLKTKNWRKFDSVWYKWESDTLHLNHIRFVKNVCGDYELNYKLIEDTLSLSFIDKTQCDLATIIETNSKIIIEKPENLVLKFNNQVLNTKNQTLHTIQ